MKNTWGAHCDKLIFMSTEEDEELGAVALEVSKKYLDKTAVNTFDEDTAKMNLDSIAH